MSNFSGTRRAISKEGWALIIVIDLLSRLLLEHGQMPDPELYDMKELLLGNMTMAEFAETNPEFEPDPAKAPW